MVELELYNLLYEKINNNLKYKLFTITPKSNEPYPFVIFETITTNQDTITKNSLRLEKVSFTFSIYEYKNNVLNFYKMINEILNSFKGVLYTYNYKFIIEESTIQKNINIDTSTNAELLHASLDVTFLCLNKKIREV